MPETKQQLKEVLPKQGLLYQEDMPTVVLCKPKILPLKSVTLEKLERMQREAQDTVKQQEAQQQQGDKQDFFSDYS
ncbi:BBSome-interacting protein 1-like [Saccostrea cucullata]|uniref:BBSome-interacting protein 1-like n=1 Tax=Saccostrea cuccullata TaxID=36930 RepID=UPI002ED4660A